MPTRKININDCQFVNKKTGKAIPQSLTRRLDDVFNADKNTVNLKELSRMIHCLGDGKATVLAWLIANKQNDNKVVGTQREIAKESGVSLAVVSRVFKLLTVNGFLRRKHCGYYIINPDAIYFSHAKDKLTIASEWDKAGDANNG